MTNLSVNTWWLNCAERILDIIEFIGNLAPFLLLALFYLQLQWIHIKNWLLTHTTMWKNYSSWKRRKINTNLYVNEPDDSLQAFSLLLFLTNHKQCYNLAFFNFPVLNSCHRTSVNSCRIKRINEISISTCSLNRKPNGSTSVHWTNNII